MFKHCFNVDFFLVEILFIIFKCFVEKTNHFDFFFLIWVNPPTSPKGEGFGKMTMKREYEFI